MLAIDPLLSPDAYVLLAATLCTSTLPYTPSSRRGTGQENTVGIHPNNSQAINSLHKPFLAFRVLHAVEARLELVKETFGDGETVCNFLREKGVKIPIIAS